MRREAREGGRGLISEDLECDEENVLDLGLSTHHRLRVVGALLCALLLRAKELNRRRLPCPHLQLEGPWLRLMGHEMLIRTGEHCIFESPALCLISQLNPNVLASSNRLTWLDLLLWPQRDAS